MCEKKCGRLEKAGETETKRHREVEKVREARTLLGQKARELHCRHVFTTRHVSGLKPTVRTRPLHEPELGKR